MRMSAESLYENWCGSEDDDTIELVIALRAELAEERGKREKVEALSNLNHRHMLAEAKDHGETKRLLVDMTRQRDEALEAIKVVHPQSLVLYMMMAEKVRDAERKLAALRDHIEELAAASKRDGRGGAWVHDVYFDTLLSASDTTKENDNA